MAARGKRFVWSWRLLAIQSLAAAVFLLSLHMKLCLYESPSPSMLLTTIKLSHDPAAADALLAQPRQAALAIAHGSPSAAIVFAAASRMCPIAGWEEDAETGLAPTVLASGYRFLFFKPPPTLRHA
jgi:hypothetical protein